jgi:hypothetical protein
MKYLILLRLATPSESRRACTLVLVGAKQKQHMGNLGTGIKTKPGPKGLEWSGEGSCQVVSDDNSILNFEYIVFQKLRSSTRYGKL